MRVIVPLAEGFEEMEAVIVVDVLRRAKLEVVSAAVGASREVLASRGVRVVADAFWKDVDPLGCDLLVVPGGLGGVDRLCAEPSVVAAVRNRIAAGKPVAAICAGPLVLHAAGVLAGRRFTCYPGVEARMAGPLRREDAVVVEDGLLLTSQGPGTAFAFALAIVRKLAGADAAAKVAAGMLVVDRR